MQVVIHRDFNQLEKIFPSWEQLADEFHEMTVFQNLSWLKNWWKYKKQQEAISPYIVEIKKAAKTIAIFPLYLSLKKFARLTFRVLKPIGSTQADYLLPILSKEYPVELQVKIVLEKIYEDKKNWDYMEWSDLPEGSIFDKALAMYIKEEDRLAMRKRTFICPYITLDSDVEKVKRNYDPKLVKEIEKKMRRLEKNGEIRYHQVTNIEEITPIVHAFFDFHCERWKDTETPSRFEIHEERVYALETAKSLLQDHHLHLAYLTYNGDIAAVEYALADEKRIYLYLTAFNPTYRKHSVGNILLYRLMQHACQQGYEVVDFTRGEESYKEQWGTVETSNVQYFLFQPSFRSKLSRAIQQTYYSGHFQKKDVIHQLATKCIIRGTVTLLSFYDSLRFKNTLKVHN